MIRPVVPGDIPAVVDLAVDSGLFPAEESGIVQTLLKDYVARTAAEGHTCLVDDRADPDGALEAVAYYEPRPATDRTWELTMIAVRRGGQGRGTGGHLMSHVEDDLRARGQRLLLVLTSGLASFARTRAFYDRAGYDQEARVRDYYEPGDDLVLYRKDLAR